ncbi:serine/threonine-protein kinase Nek8-like [Oppia nitens]|uniref:serine/threonine-protein kinase Nek8-like n=1 Tax=Oppia nitens TaxID=1686743 RepID=UPI0023DBF510|nr:serine/threonine-protein kinase Nek8-like [Oppia nitens]
MSDIKVSKGLRFADTSASIEILREERLNRSRHFLKQLNWDNYERIRFVGKGAFGTAVLYRKRSDDMLVVLKEINMNDLNATERQLAINEVKVLSILNNPNIISYFDSFESNGNLYIEMEYADAGTLAELLAQLNQPLHEYEILLIFRQIVCAINYLHQNNILHRDIKTANIFLNKEGYIKVGDFGISKMLTTKREAESVVGTPYYISPEICEGKNYNQKSDIWALGCVLYEMACLHKTFEGSNLPVLINKIVKGQFAPIRRNYSAKFRNLINELLHRDPNMRPTAQQVLDTLVGQLNKLQLDRIQMWSQYQEMPTSVITSGILIQNSSSLQYPRSTVYEVLIGEPHIKLSPLLLPPKIRIKEISKSLTHFLALTYNSVVYSWGNGSKGQLGLGESIRFSSKPECIESLRNRNIVRICAGDGFSVFISKNGLVMTCGDNQNRCLGRNETVPSFTPKLVDTLLSADVSTVSCGTNHVSIVTGDGKAYSWGYNIDGRLGVNLHNNFVDIPTGVVFYEDVCIKNVFCGPDATAFIDDKGFVWMSGNNSYNKLGFNEKHYFKTIKVSQMWSPFKLKWIKQRVLSVSLSLTNSALVVEDGQVITCGLNSDAQLGLGHVRPSHKASVVNQLSQQTIIRVQTGSAFMVASNAENVIYFWGARPVNPLPTIDIEKSENHLTSDTIKLGECNQSLMNVVEIVGPDHPIVQIRDPKIIIDNLHDLSLLNLTNKAIILKPQPIISLYSSPVHLYQGEVVGLANLYVFLDDTVYVVIDTTIPLNEDNYESIEQTPVLSTVPEEDNLTIKDTNTRENSNSLTYLSQNIPEWILQEMDDQTNNTFIELQNLSSIGDTIGINDNTFICPQSCDCHQEINKLRQKLQEKQNTILSLQTLCCELENQNQLLKRRQQEFSQKFRPMICSQQCCHIM